MKRLLLTTLATLALLPQIHAQGLLIDQESWPTPIIPSSANSVDGLFLTDLSSEELMQSFTPSLDAIDFISMEFQAGTGSATVAVNLYEGSPFTSGATLLGTTGSATMTAPFVNSGLGVAGVETFSFANPITLTPGDTYYFEPVLKSGGANWTFETIIGDTYPNGELYADGYPFVTQTDDWFQEGIVAVPEPAVFGLFGIGLLILALKRRPALPVLAFACLLLSLPVSMAHAAGSVVTATADAAGLAPVPASELPGAGGTYWVTALNPSGGLYALPWPMLPTNLDSKPIYLITNGIYLVDSTDGKLSSSDSTMSPADADAAAQSQSQTMESLIEEIEAPPLPPGAGGTNGDGTIYTPGPEGIPINTNGLYLVLTNETDSLGGVGFLLYNPDGSFNYQLLSSTNLLDTNWNLGQIVFYPGSSGNYFSPVPMTNSTAFYRVHQAGPVISIQNSQNATEMNATNDLGQQGYLYVYDEGTQTNDVPVYYSVSGTAAGGVAYSNLDGEVTITNGVGYAYIYVNPLTNGIQPNLSLILTVKQNTNYLIDPSSAVATNTIFANPEVYPIVNGDEQPMCPEITNYNVYLQANDPRYLPMSYKILNWPTHGLLNTNGAPYCSYIATNCYEGLDSFTFEVSDGQYTSGPATIILNVGNTVYANPVAAQTCRGAAVGIQLSGGDYQCGIATNFAVLTEPSHGAIGGTPPNLTYTPTGTNFTGTDTWYFVCYDGCGDSATNYVTVTVGDANLYPIGQEIMTGTNQPASVTLRTSDNGDPCTADTNDYIYTVTAGPAHGTLTGSGANLTYTPAHDFEGEDTFQFTASDGVWTSSPATITLYVAAGPILTTQCDPFGTAPELSWSLDTNVIAMEGQGLGISDFVVYRSTNSAGPFTAIATNDFTYETDWTYLDTNAVIGQAYYYAVNFESYNANTGGYFESPFSNEIATSGQAPEDLIPANAYWQVVTNMALPTHVTTLQAPLSNQYPNPYIDGIYPDPNSYWPLNTTWSNSIAVNIATNTDLSKVQYAIAIDNYYTLYANGAQIGTGNNNGVYAVWTPFQSFPTNSLHYGTNTFGVLIQDIGDVDYFSMVVTTNTCGQ